MRTTLIINTNNPRFWVSCRNGREASEGSRAPNKKVLTPEDTMLVVEGFRICEMLSTSTCSQRRLSKLHSKTRLKGNYPESELKRVTDPKTLRRR